MGAAQCGPKCDCPCSEQSQWDEGADHAKPTSFVRRHQVLSDGPDAEDGLGGTEDAKGGDTPQRTPFGDDQQTQRSDDEVSFGPAAAATLPRPGGADWGGGQPHDVDAATPPLGSPRAPPSEERSARTHDPDSAAGNGLHKTDNRTARDWASDQEQFTHLPPLPSGWIRVQSRSSGEIYYYCLSTGETTFQEPTDLPSGWVAVKSRSTGGTYYWNELLQLSQFKRPTAANGSPPMSASSPGRAGK